jgi:class 3 adenylate cyclase/predicted ATPase
VDVGAWLRGLGLEQYEQSFRDNDVGADLLARLTAEDLREIGVASVGHRRRLLDAITALQAEIAHPPVASTSQPAPDSPPAMPSPPEAERRQLTVMSVDLVGSTALSVRLDPEEMGEVLRAYQGAVAGEVARFEGHIAKFMGDGVLAYFGWPRAHEDEPERAVRAGLAAVEAVGGLKAPTGEGLAARVGIATGLVVVGDEIGSDEAREHAVVGETPNLAARLQTLAEPGAVVVSESTRRLLGHLFELVDLGARQLKGFAEPARVFRVLDESRSESRFEALHGHGLTPLVGRAQELGLLLDRWDRAKEGEGQVILLAGEAGIGKSRLVRALRERLDETYTPLSHYGSPHHTNSALHPVVARLERAAGFARDDAPVQKLDKVERLLAQAVDDVGEAAPLVASLLAIPAGDRYPRLDLTPERLKERTYAVLLDQLEGLALRRPVLAVYEDAHWFDPSTLELVERVVERVQRLPVLVVVTCRPGFSPPWAGFPHVTQLSLARLSRRQGAALVGRVVGGKALPAEVLEQILAKTDGVALFIEELTKAVLESGLLVEKDDRYELPGPLPPLAIPSTLQDSLLARLDRLAPVKEVAQVGACIGREFSHELLVATAEMPEPQLTNALDKLMAGEIVFRRGVRPEATYVFKHALMQDAAYQSLLRSRRRQLHARIAEVIERRFPSLAEAQPELAAHHLAEAGLAERAIGYLQRASRRALARSAELEAVEHLRRALRELDRLPDETRRETIEFELQAALGRALSTIRGFAAPETSRVLDRAAELGRRLQAGPKLFPVLWGQYIFHLAAGRLETGYRVAREFLDLARQQDDPGPLLTAERTVANCEIFLGRFASARRHCERVLALYDPGQHRDLALDYAYDQRVVTRDILTGVLFMLGYAEQAEEQIRQAVAEAEALRHRTSLAHALVWDSFFAHWQDDAARILRNAAAMARLNEEQAIPYWLGSSSALKGWAIGREGRFEEGAAEIRRALEALHTTGVRLFRPYFSGLLLADTEARAGRSDAALACLAEALHEAQATGDCWYEAELHRLRGELLWKHDRDAVAAEAALREAMSVAASQEARMWELRAATSLARLWAEGGERRKAHDLLASVYGWFTEGFETPALKEAKALLEECA